MDSDLQFSRFVDMLRRRARLIATIAVCGTIAVCILAWFIPVRYTAKAQIVVEEPRVESLSPQSAARDAGVDQTTILTEVTALSSHDLLATVHRLLAADPNFRAIRARAHHPETEDPDETTLSGRVVGTLDAAKAELGHWFDTVKQHVGISPVGSSKGHDNAGASPVDPDVLTIEDLQRRVKVFQELGSHVIAVSFTSTNPVEAAAVANKIASYYVDEGDEQRRNAMNRALAGITEKLGVLKSETERYEAAVAAYQEEHGLKDAAKTNVIDQKLGDLNRQLSEAQSDLAVRKARYTELLALRGYSADWMQLLAKLDAQGLIDLHNQVVDLLRSRRDSIIASPQSGGAGQNNDQATLPMREKLRRELDQSLKKLANDEEAAQSRVAAIQVRLTAVQGASDDVRLRDLVATAASARHRYDRLVQRRDELVEQRDTLSSMARLLSQAPIPDRPSSPNALLFVAPGGIVFLVFGCLVALLRDRLDQTMQSESDINAVLGLRCSGIIPRLRNLEPTRALQVLGAASAPYTEAIRSIMVGLQLVNPRQPVPKVILVTSSVPGEGKTTMAVSLAVYAARAGSRVLLLDFDFRNQVAAQAPHEKAVRDVIELMSEDQIPAEMIKTAGGMHLDYLPFKRGAVQDPLPLFSRDQMSKLLHRLRANYDYIIIDSAPVLQVAEARLLATVADKVLFAVRWGSTKRSEARHAIELLRGAGQMDPETPDKLSAVITQMDLKRHGRSHYGDRGDALAKYGSYYIPGQVIDHG